MAIRRRVVGNREGNGKSGKSNGHGNKGNGKEEGDGNGGKSN
jgi:hypothetical protein